MTADLADLVADATAAVGLLVVDSLAAALGAGETAPPTLSTPPTRSGPPAPEQGDGIGSVDLRAGVDGGSTGQARVTGEGHAW